MSPTRSASSPPSESRPPLRLSAWAITGILVLLLFGTLEIALRSGLFWRLPLTAVLKEASDVNLRAIWRIYNESPRASAVVVVGSSMADAVVEPTGVVRQDVFDQGYGAGRGEILNLAVTRSCYAEQTVLLDNALRAGHKPALVLIFAWPGCLSRNDENENRSTLLAQRLPLSSAFLDSRIPAHDFDEAVARWLTRHVAVVRFRHYANAWLRTRAKLVMRGRRPTVKRFRADGRAVAWTGPWESDAVRREQLVRYARKFLQDGPETEPLAILLELLRDRGVRAVLVEAPWSPPTRSLFGPASDVYHGAVQRVADQYHVPYVDLNSSTGLLDEHFSDSYHVDTAGSEIYLRALGAWLASSGY